MENGDAPGKVKVLDVLLRPRCGWTAVAAAPIGARQMIVRYVLPFAAVPAIATVAGAAIFGVTISAVSFHPAIPALVMAGGLIYLATLAVVFALSGVIHGFAPVFDGDRRYVQALKLAGFASIPGWLGGGFLVLPGLWPPAVVATLYGFYLLALGIGPLMGVRRERSVIYGALVLSLFAVFWGLGSFANLTTRIGLVPQPGEISDGRLSARGVGSIDLRKAREALRQMREDQAGGHAVSPTPPDELETLLPAELAPGHQKVATNSRVLSVGKLSGSTAQGDYRLEKRRIVITVTDAGAAKALMDAVMLDGSRQSAEGYEKAIMVDGRPTIEKYNRLSNSGEYAVVVAGRYIVQARGDADMGTLRAAAHAVSFERLEAMAEG